MNALSNTVEILNPVIPLTDLTDAGMSREHPGHKPIMEILRNNNRLLDDKFWVWRYRIARELPMFSEEN